MTNSSQIIANQALSLSAEERTFIVDTILQSLEHQPYHPEENWIHIIQSRMEEMTSSKEKPALTDLLFQNSNN